MRIRNTFVCLCVIVGAMLVPATGFAVEGQAPAAAEAGGILIKFRSTTSLRNQTRSLRSAGCRGVQNFTLVSGLTYARITSGLNTAQTISLLALDPNVEYAEPNYMLTAADIPNDPRFADLYGLNNSGQTGGVVDADIDAPEAWDLQTGADTVIAVIDTGVDYNHNDLAANIWRNAGEIANNRIDDDGNGYIDDIRGWDFANNDNDPVDDNNHGTHVSGTIAALGNNAIGVTGINWSARIMPVKFMTAAGAGGVAAAVGAIQYAVRNGAKVINASWGGAGFSNAMFNAIAAANNAGVLFVAAAGNNGANTDNRPSYPADYDLANVLSVAATDSSDRLATFSNFGVNSVDLGAPGVGIVSTIRNNAYAAYSGTSMAAPHVTGVAGLVLAANPELSVTELRTAILSTTDALPALAGRTVTGGRLNAFNAVSSVAAATPAPPAPPPMPALTLTPQSGTLALGGTLQFNAAGGVTPYTYSVDNPVVATINSISGLLTALAAGNTAVTVTDNTGSSVSTGSINIVSLEVAPQSANLTVADNLQFTAIGGNAPYTWSSSNGLVATIDASTGVLTAVNAGTTRVSAVDVNGFSASSGTINVSAAAPPPPPPAPLSITPQTGILGIGQVLRFTVTGGVGAIVWSSSNAAVASISSSGLLTGVGAGTMVVSATDGNGVSVTSGNIEVRRVEVSPGTGTLASRATLQFTASGGALPYAWSTSDSTVATIDASGLLTALAPGVITVSAMDANAISGSSGAINITDSTPLSVTPITAVLIIGDSQTFSATGGIGAVTWSTTDITIANISNLGVLTALTAGTVAVIATDELGNSGRSDPLTILAVAPIITISPFNTTLGVGAARQFTATGGSRAPYTWAINNAASATIDATSGVLTGTAAGTVVVSATDANGFTGSSGVVTISAASANIVVTPQVAALATGASLQFSATGGIGSYTWSVSNPISATINANGLLTGLIAGAVIITATDGNGANGSSSTVTITAGGRGMH